MFPQQLVLREQEQRTRQVAAVYSLSSMGDIPTTPVNGATLVPEGGGTHSMLSTKMIGIIVVRINVIFHEIYIPVFSSKNMLQISDYIIILNSSYMLPAFIE